MDWLEEIRKNFGLKQEELAVYLSVARPTLSLAESSKRDLPASAMILLAPMLHTQPTPLTGEIMKKYEQLIDADNKQLAKETESSLRVNYLKLQRARKRLVQMQEKYRQAVNAFHLAQRLQELPVATAEQMKRREIFLGCFFANACCILGENGPAAQAPLKEAIKVYELLAGDE